MREESPAFYAWGVSMIFVIEMCAGEWSAIGRTPDIDRCDAGFAGEFRPSGERRSG